MWDIVGNPVDQFSHNEAQLVMTSAEGINFVKLVLVIECKKQYFRQNNGEVSI